MELRKFHVWDLNPNKFWIGLDKELRLDLFKKAGNLFTGNYNERYTKLANLLGYSNYSVIQKWISGSYIAKGKRHEVLIPLKVIPKLIKLLNGEISLNDIENHIITIRSKTGKMIRNFKLPVPEDERLIRILFHLMGDGFHGKSKFSPSYQNTVNVLINEFEKDLEVLGDVPTHKLYYYKDRPRVLHKIQFPIVASHILSSFYDIQFGIHTSEVPNEIFELPENLRRSAIRAFADDEGNVDSNRVRFYSSNEKLLKGVRRLVLSINGIKPENVSEVKNIKPNSKEKEFCFYIRVGSLKVFAKEIGFSHPKRSYYLSHVVKRIGRGQLNRRGVGVTKRMILNFIRKGINIIKNLSIELSIDESNVYRHLRELEDRRKVRRAGKVGKRTKWELA